MTNTTREPFTTATWAGLSSDQAYLSREYFDAHRWHWEHEVDLAHELAERDDNPLTLDQARSLVCLTIGQTPLILTWVTRHREFIETTRASVIVEYLGTQYARVRYCGFGHGVYLSQITGVEVPNAEYTFENV